ncbi:MAG: chemotaxis protein CheW, partial [Janthinobacterium lividum]
TMLNTDMLQYLDVFLDEGREQLVLLEAGFLDMERGHHTAETMQALFRAAHTLKGSSRTMGFQSIGDLTHEMENILDDLRNNKLSVSTPIVDVLLECLDALGSLVDAVAATQGNAVTCDKDIPALVAHLTALRTGGAAAPEAKKQPEINAEAVEAKAPASAFALADHEEASLAAAVDSELNVYHVAITLDADCLMKAVRVWMVMSALEPLGAVLASDPPEDKLEDEEFGAGFAVLLVSSADAEEIDQALSKVAELASVTVQPWAAAPAITEPIAEEAPVVAAPTAMAAPTAIAAPTASAPASAPAPVASPTIRVEVSRLDSLLNLVGELVIERAQISRVSGDLSRAYPRDENATQLLEATHRIARITAELQDQIMKARMLPIDGVFQRMPRMVRDLAQKTGKDIRFEMTGGETELDRTVLEVISDPLIHLLRNSVDHGVEVPDAREAAGKPRQGLVTLSARQEANHIVLEITDDGGGMDPEKLKASALRKGVLTEAAAALMTEQDALHLIFASGFSTAEVLSDISGRGVGMDIVRSNLEKLGGRIQVESVVGRGSRFLIHLPLTLAIVRAVLVESGGGDYVLPLGNVVELLMLGTGQNEVCRRTLAGQAVIDLRGRTIPLASLSGLLQGRLEATQPEEIAANAFVVVVGAGDKQLGLCVDGLAGEQEVVIKSLGTLLGDLPGLSGATILGDGRVALIVDLPKIISGRQFTQSAGTQASSKNSKQVSYAH